MGSRGRHHELDSIHPDSDRLYPLRPINPAFVTPTPFIPFQPSAETLADLRARLAANPPRDIVAQVADIIGPCLPATSFAPHTTA